MSSSPTSSSASISACDAIAELFRPYLEGTAAPEDAAMVLAHLKTCDACKAEFQSRQKVLSLLNQTYGEKRISDGFEVKADRRVAQLKSSKGKPAPSALFKASARSEEMEHDETEAFESAEADPGTLGRTVATLGAAPWWMVSAAMHILVIALASLVSMAIELPHSDDSVIMLTELQNRPQVETAQEEPKKAELRDALNQKETPATDPNSKESSEIVVPPDILAKAELGDHFETINPDLPDTHSAFGNPDSKSFHSVEGNSEPPGGGGMNGLGMDDLIGVGGAASKGTGGGFGGGDGTGTGVGTGAGHGTFGQRSGGGRKLMVMRHGGSAKTENAVDKALEWLAYHQEADGSWSTMKHEGTINGDAGITGLALLAFLGAGHSERVGMYKDNVKHAVAWIISQQRADGAIGSDPKFVEHHGGFAYHHAMCGMALVEAAGMSRIPETKAAAQKAVDYTCDIYQYGDDSEKLAWRYGPKAKEADISVSGWFIMQLKSAKMAGLHVNPASFEGALKFLASRETDPEKVKKEDDGYDTGKHRYGYLDRTPMHNTTAIGSLCQLFLGTKREEMVGSAMWLLRTCPPAWKADLGVGNGGAWPMYYTYYTSLFMFQVGGDQWKQWNTAMKEMLLPNQRKDGDFAGSWDTLSDWEKKCGRCYSTALGALSLEVYYRYLQLGH